MAINVAGLVPASIKSKNVATEQYVDTSIAGIDISNTLNTNNDVFAKRLGYLSYADMVSKATNGQTIINGGYLRGELIEANSITAGQIAANAISGKTITGGTISGAIINGVQINGAIIKGSFIDMSSSLALSNWKFYTPATVPPAYVGNFAHNNDGTLVVDSDGYVRLPAQTGFITNRLVKNLSGDLFVSSPVAINDTYNETFSLFPWDDYTFDTVMRPVYKDVNISKSSGTFNTTIEMGMYVGSNGYSWDGSYNYYYYTAQFLSDTITGYTWINTNSSGGHSYSQLFINGSLVLQAAEIDRRDTNVSHSRRISGIEYTVNIDVIFDNGQGYYTTETQGDPEGGYYQVEVYHSGPMRGYSAKHSITCDLGEASKSNSVILDYNRGKLFKFIERHGTMYSSPDSNAQMRSRFKIDVEYPSILVQ